MLGHNVCSSLHGKTLLREPLMGQKLATIMRGLINDVMKYTLAMFGTYIHVLDNGHYNEVVFLMRL